MGQLYPPGHDVVSSKQAEEQKWQSTSENSVGVIKKEGPDTTEKKGELTDLSQVGGEATNTLLTEAISDMSTEAHTDISVPNTLSSVKVDQDFRSQLKAYMGKQSAIQI